MMDFTKVILCIFILSSSTFAQPTTQPDEIDAESLDRAELNLLRRRVQQQDQLIAELRTQVASLTSQLEELGIAPAAATSQPTTRPAVRRVVFVRAVSGSPKSAEQILAAVNELDDKQYFNVLTPTPQETYRFEPTLVSATDRNKQKLAESLKPNVYFEPRWLDGLEIAAKWRPDVIWLIGGPAPSDEDAEIEEMKRRIAGSGSRINTSLLFARSSAAGHHMLWRIAHETGGVCLDAHGQPISEPALPVKPATRPAPPPPKTVLQVE